MKHAKTLAALGLIAMSAQARADAHQGKTESMPALRDVAINAEQRLRQTFTHLRFEDFGPSPIKGPIYQALAGGRLLYYAPESDHLLFAAIYDRNGANLTAASEEAFARAKLAMIDTSQALAIGPAGSPTVIEFTDPDCPYCRSLDRFWAAKEAQGKPVRRLVFFVTGLHPNSAAKAEHILCSADKEAAFHAIYGGAAPDKLVTCPEGQRGVAAHSAAVARMGIQGTPTLVAGDHVIAGFRQGEIEAFLESAAPRRRETSSLAVPVPGAPAAETAPPP